MHRIFPSLLAAAVLALGHEAAAQSSAPDLPDIGSPADATITRNDEYQIGQMIVRGLREQGQVMDDPEVNDYIQTIGSRIAAQAQDGGQRFQFFVVRDGAINAFALPGGFIGVNQGLMTATANESQLASVLAHEIAHVTQRHIARSIRAQGRQSLASAAAILAAILIGATTGSPDAAQAGIAIAQGTAAQQRINFTRANEYEADRIGIGFLAAAGFDPFGMPDFFETLGRRSGLAGSMVPEFLQTHPVTSNRIAESRDRAAQIARNVLPESPAYQYVRERVRVLGAPPEADLRPYYAALRERRELTPGQQYGEALAQMRAGEREAAAGTLIELSAARQGSPMLQAALGQALMSAGRQDRALATFREGLAIAPRNVPLSVRYAEALMQAGRAREAHEVLLDVFNNVPPTPEQIRLTALAASDAGATGDAYYYMSEYHIASGDLPLAGKQLELALAAPDLTPVQRARFSARLKEIRDVLAESARGRWRAREASNDAGMMPR
ncbi:MAG: M48 family metalloprotease [Steroidobacteraceae bacterium]|jgi:predicted Zn-dependent protease|nr:M48 family metalloprotease [Steroidobacteraceae bacterium]